MIYIFFDTFGIEGLKHFIIQDDKKIVKKILIGIEKMDRSDKKITLCKIKFNMSAYKRLLKKEIDSLSETAQNLFHFINAFGKKLNLKSFVNVWMVEDRLQDLDSAACGIFQIYFYENLFNLDKNSSIQNDKKLNKSAIEKLLNELFTLEDVDNEQKMEA